MNKQVQMDAATFLTGLCRVIKNGLFAVDDSFNEVSEAMSHLAAGQRVILLDEDNNPTMTIRKDGNRQFVLNLI